MLDARDLHVTFTASRGIVGTLLRRPLVQARAVDGVSFHVERGEIVALVGESGSGKTTTGQAALGLLHGYRGDVRFDGVDLATLRGGDRRRLRRRMQMVYQDPYQALNPRLTVAETVAEPLDIHGIRDDREGRIVRALEAAGLTPPDLFLDRLPHQLSGGQRQRAAIAASLALEPDFLVADEPVSMLDVSIRAGILAVFDALRQRGVGILMITHDLATAAHLADRIEVMYLGRIVERGPTAALLANPAHPYTKALLAAVPEPDPRHIRAGRVGLVPGDTPDPAAIPPGCRFHPRCPVAQPECPTIDPALRVVDRDHSAACVLVADQPEAVRDTGMKVDAL
jgi:oligopeptide/dipeptide ABC transporter ATP-binding protein